MKKSPVSTMIGLSLALFLGLTGCTQYDLKTPQRAATPAAPPFEPKPLPACGPTTPLQISWNLDENAFDYVFEIDISFSHTPADWSEGLEGNATTVEHDLNTRGTWYFARVTKTTMAGVTRTIPLSFYLPNCAERDDWQKAHPEYVEPVKFNIAL